MDRAAELLAYVNVAVFLGLALLSLRLWARERGASSAWFAVTMVIIAGVALTGQLLDETPDTAAEELETKILVAVLVLFPYTLFRFTTTFSRSGRWVEILAALGLVGLIVWTFLLPDFPGEGEERSTGFEIYILGLLALWTALSLLAAGKLWRSGASEPSIARKRMRLLSLASVGVNFSLVVAGSAPPDQDLAQLISQVLAAVSGMLFYLAFSPPAFLRESWRRKDQVALRKATMGLMTARTQEEVGTALLPHVVRNFGGRAAALVNKDGSIISSHGKFNWEKVDLSDLGDTSDDVIKIELPFGGLAVMSSPFTPFFATEDLALLQGIGALTDLAMERIRFLEAERVHIAEIERMNADLAEAQRVAQLGSWEWIVADDAITWTDELYRIFGVDPADFAASYEAYLMLVHPDDRDLVNAAVDKAYRTGEFSEMDHRVVRPDGGIRWVRSRGRTIMKPDGSVEKMIGTAQDITERKLAEEYERELRDSALRQRQALELNDNVVQGLAVAGMALELGDTQKAKEAISKTMAAAQAIISGLLRGTGKDREIMPGDLIRSAAADLPEHRERTADEAS